MERKITILPNNKKALALLDKLQEKKQQIKKQMHSSPIPEKLKLKLNARWFNAMNLK